jgi:lambda family phage portal protein
MAKPTKGNIIDRAVGFFNPAAGLRRQRVRMAKRIYEGAAIGRRAASWKALHTSQNAESMYALRPLRDRSRDLARNTPHAARMLDILTAHTVGTGIIPVSATGKDGLDNKVNQLWEDWAHNCDITGMMNFYAMQALAVRSMVESGEVVIRMIDQELPDADAGGSLRKAPVPTYLQILEADYIDQFRDGIYGDEGQVDIGKENRKAAKRVIRSRLGVGLGEYDRFVGLWLFRNHPGELNTIWQLPYVSDFISGDHLIHMFKVLRPGQVRGVPWMAPILSTGRDFSDFMDAVNVKAKVEACFAAFILNDDTSDGALFDPSQEGLLASADMANPNAQMTTLEPGMLKELRAGQDIKFAAPTSTSQIEPIMLFNLQAMAAGIGCTYDQITGDLRQANYSSLRAGKLDFWRLVKQLQRHTVIPKLCKPVWDRFISRAILAGQLKKGDYPVDWVVPAVEYIDPKKDADAEKNEVRSGRVTPQAYIAARGGNWRQDLKDFSDFFKKAHELDVTLDIDVSKVDQHGRQPTKGKGAGDAEDEDGNPIVNGVSTKDDDEDGRGEPIGQSPFGSSKAEGKRDSTSGATQDHDPNTGQFAGGSASYGKDVDDEGGKVWWHGSASGDLRGGTSGLHVGTFKAATQALEARIGIPADGHGWKEKSEYGKTLLAGTDTILKVYPDGYHNTGFNYGSSSQDFPKDDFYPGDYFADHADQHPRYPDGSLMPLTVTPRVSPFRIVGKMSNSQASPHEDFKANGYMKAQLKKGSAKSGYFYKNVGEDEGSISAVVPNGNHLEPVKISDTTRTMGEPTGYSPFDSSKADGKRDATSGATQEHDPDTGQFTSSGGGSDQSGETFDADSAKQTVAHANDSELVNLSKAQREKVREVHLAAYKAQQESKSGTAEKPSATFEFVSPNVGQLTFTAAAANLDSYRQQALLVASDEVDKKLGMDGTNLEVIGAWSDGAENSVMDAHVGGTWDQLVLSASIKGWLADQKSVLVFQSAEDGKQALAYFEAKGDIEAIHTNLLNQGVAFHTIMPTGDGARVYVALTDPATVKEQIAALGKVAESYDSKVNVAFGRAEFIPIGGVPEEGTDREQRDGARSAYEDTIRKSPVPKAREIFAELRNHWGTALDNIAAGSNVAEAMQAEARTIAQSQGFNPDHVTVTAEAQIFRVGTKLFAQSGAYNHKTGNIILNTPGIQAGELKAVLSHEIEHHKFQVAYRHAGKLVRQYIDRNKVALRTDDGVTKYSASYWGDTGKSVSSTAPKFNAAVNETLAEIACVRAESKSETHRQTKEPTKVWTDLFDLVEREFRSAQA